MSADLSPHDSLLCLTIQYPRSQSQNNADALIAHRRCATTRVIYKANCGLIAGKPVFLTGRGNRITHVLWNHELTLTLAHGQQFAVRSFVYVSSDNLLRRAAALDVGRVSGHSASCSQRCRARSFQVQPITEKLFSYVFFPRRRRAISLSGCISAEFYQAPLWSYIVAGVSSISGTHAAAAAAALHSFWTRRSIA